MREEIKRAVDVLRQGGVILYPTDTIWGLGCDATNEVAVSRVYEIKQRADTKSMLVLTDSLAKVEVYTDEMPDIAYDLLEATDRPLTIIYPKARHLATNLVAEDGSIGIRITHERFSQSLCEAFRKPVVSTSANVSGQPAPRFFAEISDEICQAVDYTVNYRQDERTVSRPSSIIRLGRGGLIQIIRE